MGLAENQTYQILYNTFIVIWFIQELGISVFLSSVSRVDDADICKMFFVHLFSCLCLQSHTLKLPLVQDLDKVWPDFFKYKHKYFSNGLTHHLISNMVQNQPLKHCLEHLAFKCSNLFDAPATPVLRVAQKCLRFQSHFLLQISQFLVLKLLYASDICSK